MSSPGPTSNEGLDTDEALLLERAAEKLVLYGGKVGVTPEEMVSLLDSGLSVRDLLILLASKNAGAA